MMHEISALGAVLLVALAEWLHSRRVRRVARLAFGPTGQARPWTRTVPVFRCLAAGLLVWGSLSLLSLGPVIAKPKEIPEGGYRHLILALDVSPSMQLKDAGPAGDQTRAQRASDVIMSLLGRVALDQIRVSVVAFYTTARPVVVDTFDLNVVKNILDDLPLDLAFEPGKTDLFSGIAEASELARPWEPESTTLILVSDGDTVPDKGSPRLPKSMAQVMIVGVGDPQAGKYIDGHQSRQDIMTLRQLAARVGGVYFDANRKHLPSQALSALAKVFPLKEEDVQIQRLAALSAMALGALILSALPVGLAFLGVSWQPLRQKKPLSKTRASHPARNFSNEKETYV